MLCITIAIYIVKEEYWFSHLCQCIYVLVKNWVLIFVRYRYRYNKIRSYRFYTNISSTSTIYVAFFCFQRYLRHEVKYVAFHVIMQRIMSWNLYDNILYVTTVVASLLVTCDKLLFWAVIQPFARLLFLSTYVWSAQWRNKDQNLVEHFLRWDIFRLLHYCPIENVWPIKIDLVG